MVNHPLENDFYGIFCARLFNVDLLGYSKALIPAIKEINVRV